MEEFIINTTEYEINKEDILNICKIVFKKLKVKNPIFNITIVDNKTIQEINKKYRNKDMPTDVISFAFEEVNDYNLKSIRELGEIYISVERAKEQSIEYNHPFKREICFLTVHGLLHLLGYDHIKKADEKKMRLLEESVLKEYDVER